MLEDLKDFNPLYLSVFGAIFALSLAIPAALSRLRRRTLVRAGVTRRLFSPEIFSLFATVYAFFLGFSIATLWSNYNAAKSDVTLEAAACLNTYRLSYSLPGGEGLRASLDAYLTSVLDDEWPQMRATNTMSERTAALFEDAWRALRAAKPQDKADNTFHAAVGQGLADMGRLRLARAQALSGNLYPPVWVVLVFGLFAVLVGLFLTNPEQTKSQMAMEVIVGFLIFSCLFFISDIATPFSGIIIISNAPMLDAHATLHALAAAAP